MHQVVVYAVEEYLVRNVDDEETRGLAEEGAARFRDVLDRLGQ